MFTEQNQKVINELPQTHRKLFENFAKIIQVPRISPNPEKITAYLKQWFADHKIECQVDEFNNILARIPANCKELENAPMVCLQGHTDMVPARTATSTHDFEKDPIEMKIVDGKWIWSSHDSSLGADDGYALAACMTIIEDSTCKHGPLEILFTSQEEIGLIGASKCKFELKSKYLINLDSEDSGHLCVSCAGGENIGFDRLFQLVKLGQHYKSYKIEITGGLGGHSGAEIQCYRFNAIKGMARVLDNVCKCAALRLVSMNAGSAHNAIPGCCTAVVSVACDCNFSEKIQQIFARVAEPYMSKEKALAVKVTPVECEKAFSVADTQNIIDFINNIQHGPMRKSQEIDLIETSYAITIINTDGEHVHMLGSGRSCYESELDFVEQQMVSLARLAGWKCTGAVGRYPGWPADFSAPVIEQVKTALSHHVGDVIVEAIHAGLECGMLVHNGHNMEAVSFGPTILSPHSPQERMEITTATSNYDALLEFLQNVH